jgi:hypothetical protein
VPSPRSLAITIYRAALLGGAAVGIVDGARAAQLGHLGGASLLSCVALVAGFDVLIGAVGGVVLAALLGLGAWGRQRASRWVTSAIGWLLVGGLAAIAPVVALVGTANRNNRFLAAGIAALASLLAAAAAAVLGPALARALPFSSPRSGSAASVPAGKSVTAAGLLLLAPLSALLLEVAVFFLVWRTRAPLHRDVRIVRSVLAGATTAVLPWIISRASLAWPRLAWPKALAGALVLFGVPTSLLIRARWAQDFQFVAWNEVRVVLGLVLATLVLGFLLPRRPAGRKWRPIALLAGPPLLAVATVFVVSESEPARKAASAQAGFTGALVALGQRSFDFDHDGYSRFFGGGDCDDHDPGRNPGAQDWPDDGIDQDCDGKDASVESLRSPAFPPGSRLGAGRPQILVCDHRHPARRSPRLLWLLPSDFTRA